jgi:hypothetical protein
MGDYRIFPTPRSSEIARYENRQLPSVPQNPPSQVYITQQSSASVQSILTTDIPSSSFPEEEIHQIWSRASQQSFLSNDAPRPDSLATISEFSRYSRRRSSAQLPNPPRAPYDHSSVDAVPCRLSSASTAELDYSPSPVAAKRSATPDLLYTLRNDLEGLSFADRAKATSTAPTTPDESFSSFSYPASVVYQEVNYSGSSSSTTLDITDMSPPPSPKTLVRKSKPANIFTATFPGHRNISSPVPSPALSSGHSPLLRCNTNESAVDPSYRPWRPAPLAPSAPIDSLPAGESFMEWDSDDDKASKLARVKKSIGDLRAAATRAPKAAKERKAEKLNGVAEPSTVAMPSRPRAQRSMTAPTQPLLPQPQSQHHQTSAARPGLPRTVSSGKVRTSLPTLPARTSSTRAPTATATVPSTSCPSAEKISHKASIRIAAGPSSSSLNRQRAISDAKSAQSFSLFPSTPVSSLSKRSSKALASSTTTPSSSPRSVNTVATTISSGTTAVDSEGSRQSSMSFGDKPLPNPHAANMKPTKRKVVKPALGNKRFSVLSFASIRSNGKSKPSRKPSSAAPRPRVVGLGKFRRWWRWVSRCSTIPAMTSASVVHEKSRTRQVSSPVPSCDSTRAFRGH